MTEQQPLKYYEAYGVSRESLIEASSSDLQPDQVAKLATDSIAWELEGLFGDLESSVRIATEAPQAHGKSSEYYIREVIAPSIERALPVLDFAINGDYSAVSCEIKRRASSFSELSTRTKHNYWKSNNTLTDYSRRAESLEAVAGQIPSIGMQYQIPDNAVRLKSIFETGGDN